MGRNEVEVFFDGLSQRHVDKSIALTSQQAEFFRNGDLDQVVAVGELIKQETGRLRFLNEYTAEVVSTLRSNGIDIQEKAEITEVVSQAAQVEEEKIPETFITPDGTELPGETGKLLAFLAHRDTFKDRYASAAHMYGNQDRVALQKVGSLVNYIRQEESTAFKLGVRIETELPSPKEMRQGARSKDKVVLVKESQLQAAFLADVMLAAYDRDSQKLQQLGVNLGQAGIKELQGIRQQGGVIKPELKIRLMEAGQALLLRFLADVPAVYDELAKNPDYKETLIALSYFTPLAQSGKGVFDQLFKQ